MLILTIRTDKPESEIGLYDDQQQLAYETWEAHRKLAETIHVKIADLLMSCGKNLNDLQGLVVYKGPGSFTGLRIGLSVANAFSYGLSIPLVAENESWIETGIRRLLNNDADTLALPDYGAPVHITVPKK